MTLAPVVATVTVVASVSRAVKSGPRLLSLG